LTYVVQDQREEDEDDEDKTDVEQLKREPSLLPSLAFTEP